MTDTNDIYPMLGANGPLALELENFAPRQSQQQMAHAVEQCIAGQHTLVCEAATGIGKTFAYLMPAILSRKNYRLNWHKKFTRSIGETRLTFFSQNFKLTD